MKIITSRIIYCLLVIALAVTMFTSCSSDVAENTNGPKASDYPPLKADVADYPIEMVDGTPSKISDRKGKVVLVNLWATWCGFCRVEMPHLITMQNQYAGKGFTVLGLDIGDQNTAKPEPIDDIKNFAATMGLNYELARVDTAMVGRFQQISRFSGVPQSFLIDREGRLRGVFLGGSQGAIAQMESIVDKVVNE